MNTNNRLCIRTNTSIQYKSYQYINNEIRSVGKAYKRFDINDWLDYSSRDWSYDWANNNSGVIKTSEGEFCIDYGHLGCHKFSIIEDLLGKHPYIELIFSSWTSDGNSLFCAATIPNKGLVIEDLMQINISGEGATQLQPSLEMIAYALSFENCFFPNIATTTVKKLMGMMKC